MLAVRWGKLMASSRCVGCSSAKEVEVASSIHRWARCRCALVVIGCGVAVSTCSFDGRLPGVYPLLYPPRRESACSLLDCGAYVWLESLVVLEARKAKKERRSPLQWRRSGCCACWLGCFGGLYRMQFNACIPPQAFLTETAWKGGVKGNASLWGGGPLYPLPFVPRAVPHIGGP